MQEPPVDLPNEVLEAALHAHHGLAVTAITFLPLGHDSSAWVYRVRTTAGNDYFLKVRLGIANRPGLLVPRHLQDHGVAQVVAPLPTTTGTLWAEVAGYALILYPFIEGATGMEQGMAPPQWVAYGAVLRRIHGTPVADALARLMRRETYRPDGAATVRRVAAHLESGSLAYPAARELAAIWQERRATIEHLLERAEDLGRQLTQRALPLVLCHADIHTNNVMLDAAGQLWIVDWDETVLAPRERDLMFVVGGGISRSLVGPDEEQLFLQGYGPSTLDPLALSYYRHAWAVSDIGAFAAQVCCRPDLGAASRRAAVGHFMSLFQPGQIVALAEASD